VNEKIGRETERQIIRAAGQSPTTISRRIRELDEEWDIERYLEMNASALAFTGVALGLFVNKKFFAIPAIVLPFLFQHAVQGWCPPIPILRRRGIRTRKEIDTEKFALKALRGDFADVSTSKNGGTNRAREAWQAVNA
jgi:DNA-binding Lrp family transcriptional regulator